MTDVRALVDAGADLRTEIAERFDPATSQEALYAWRLDALEQLPPEQAELFGTDPDEGRHADLDQPGAVALAADDQEGLLRLLDAWLHRLHADVLEQPSETTPGYGDWPSSTGEE